MRLSGEKSQSEQAGRPRDVPRDRPKLPADVMETICPELSAAGSLARRTDKAAGDGIPRSLAPALSGNQPCNAQAEQRKGRRLGNVSQVVHAVPAAALVHGHRLDDDAVHIRQTDGKPVGYIIDVVEPSRVSDGGGRDSRGRERRLSECS